MLTVSSDMRELCLLTWQNFSSTKQKVLLMEKSSILHQQNRMRNLQLHNYGDANVILCNEINIMQDNNYVGIRVKH